MALKVRVHKINFLNVKLTADNTSALNAQIHTGVREFDTQKVNGSLWQAR